MTRIFLTGMTCSGKTTVGQMLAERLNLPFVDLDAEIERSAGRAIRNIFSEMGERAFRDYETAALLEALQKEEAVIALGAGALDRDWNFELVRAAGTLIYLKAGLDVLMSREVDPSCRPLLAGVKDKEELRERLGQMLFRREPRYQTAPITITMDTVDRPEDIVCRALEALKDAEG